MTLNQRIAKIAAVMLIAATLASQRAESASPRASDSTRSPAAAIALTAHQVASFAYGYDTCNAPTHAQMQAFWSGSPAWWWGIYIGGANMDCSNTNVDQSWIDTEIARGWRMQFIWVGPQPPCTPLGNVTTFSSNTSTAGNQGHSNAASAVQSAFNLGINLASLPITYDMEAFPNPSSSCLLAAKAFMKGWANELHSGSPNQLSGLYGSTCASNVDDFYTSTPNPDYIWGAQFDGDGHTSDMSPCVYSTHWSGARHKQYLGNVSRTYGGVTLNVDVDCSNGAPVYGNSDTYTESSCS